MKHLLLLLISFNAFSANPTNYTGSKKWLIEVNRGNVPGHSLINKFGGRLNASTTHAQVWNSPTVVDMVYPTVGETLSIVSSDTNDTAAGTGARSVYVECLDSTTWKTVTEVVAMNGTTPVTSTINCIRFQRGWVVDVGTYGGKGIGTITITGATSTNPYGYMFPEDGRTRNSQYTVPADKTGYILHISLSVDAGKTASYSLHKRENADVIAAPFTATTMEHIWEGVIGGVSEDVYANHILPGKTDVFFDAEMSSGSGIVQVDYAILLTGGN